MAKKRINGEDILKKITPLLIDVDSKDPKYFPLYMKYKYRRERLSSDIKDGLERDCEKLFINLRKALEGILP